MTSRIRNITFSTITLLVATIAMLFSGTQVVQATDTGDSDGAGSETQVAELPSFSKDQPLILIVDISGSMEDADSSGVPKLAAAQKAMTELIRSHAGRSVLGLWTYPGDTAYGDSGCPAGGWVANQSPDNNPNADDVIVSINALQAAGGTPTGPAIEEAVRSLRSKGFESATLVLVSDGESNCGPDPCNVAQRLANSGFDLQVAAIGFDISSAGKEELQCIADATDGTYSDVDESSKLIDELAKYLTKPVEVEVSAPTSIRSGGNAEFVVKITNPSNEEISGLTAVIAMDSDKSRQIFPQILAPQKKLPVLGPGKSARIWWTATAASQQTGKASWRILVGSETDGAVLTSGEVRVTNEPLSIADAGPLLQGLQGPVVVLGDSYSSGEGAGPYIETRSTTEKEKRNTKPEEPYCHRSMLSYGGRLGAPKSGLIACSGAVTANINLTKQSGVERTQTSDLISLISSDKPPGAVVLTSGGNDIGFANIVRQCYLGTCKSGEGALKDAWQHLPGLSSSLESAYQAILWEMNTPEALRSRGGQIAPLIVSPYPDPFWAPSRGKCNGVPSGSVDAAVISSLTIQFSNLGLYSQGSNTLKREFVKNLGFDANEIRAGKKILEGLNSQVRNAVSSLAAKGYPIYFADSIVDFAQPNHTICNDDPYFVPLHFGDVVARRVADKMPNDDKPSQELMHPNAAGYQAWADAIIEWTQTTRTTPVRTLPPDFGPPGYYSILVSLNRATFQAEQKLNVDWRYGSSDHVQSLTEPLKLRQSGSVNVRADGLLAGTDFTVSLHSTPLMLASLPVNEEGIAEGVVELPANLQLGEHELVLGGIDTGVNSVRETYAVTIQAAIPLWFWIISGVGVGALLGGAILLVVGLRRRPTPPPASPIRDFRPQKAKIFASVQNYP